MTSPGAGGRKASVIIRTKNEEDGIGATLAGVLSQRVRPHEILMIDSGSVDRTLEIAARYPVRILHIAPGQFRYPTAINQAAAEATGEILVCLSAHCPPVGPDWLGNLLRHFDDPSVAGVWGPNLRPARPVPEPGEATAQGPGSYTVANRTWGLSNSNSAIRRSLWEELPFDESMPATEDKAWGLAAMERGYLIVHEPAAAVWHAHHTFASAYRRNRAVQAGFGMMFPELRRPLRQQLRIVVHAAGETLSFHASNRQWAPFWYDLRRIPSAVAASVGAMLASRHR